MAVPPFLFLPAAAPPTPSPPTRRHNSSAPGTAGKVAWSVHRAIGAIGRGSSCCKKITLEVAFAHSRWCSDHRGRRPSSRPGSRSRSSSWESRAAEPSQLVRRSGRGRPCVERRCWRRGEEAAGGSAGKKQWDDAPPPLLGGNYLPRSRFRSFCLGI
jgi:hypothetical protein